MASETVKASNAAGGEFVRVDVSSFKQLAKDLRAAKSPLVKELRARLITVGGIVASDARSRAEAASKTIPPSIKVRVSGVAVSVVAGGEGIPLAGLMELGNKKSNEGRVGGSGTFRAPNFPPKGSRGQRAFLYGGHDQKMHPYLVPALKAHESAVEDAAREVLDDVMAKFVEGGSGG